MPTGPGDSFCFKSLSPSLSRKQINIHKKKKYIYIYVISLYIYNRKFLQNWPEEPRFEDVFIICNDSYPTFMVLCEADIDIDHCSFLSIS